MFCGRFCEALLEIFKSEPIDGYFRLFGAINNEMTNFVFALIHSTMHLILIKYIIDDKNNEQFQITGVSIMAEIDYSQTKLKYFVAM